MLNLENIELLNFRRNLPQSNSDGGKLSSEIGQPHQVGMVSDPSLRPKSAVLDFSWARRCRR